MRRSLAPWWVLVVLAGCAERPEPPTATESPAEPKLPLTTASPSAEPREVERPSSMTSEVAELDAREAEQALDHAESELGRALGLSEPDCSLSGELVARICALSERLCALAEGAPEDSEGARRCTDGKARCERARQRLADRCP